MKLNYLTVVGWSVALVIVFCVALVACKKPKADQYVEKIIDAAPYHTALYGLTEVITHDFFPPPVAARIYAYANLAGYEAMAAGDATLQTLSHKVNGLENLPKPDSTQPVHFPLAATWAMLKVGKALTFSEDSVALRLIKAKSYYEALGMPAAEIQASVVFGDTIASAIIAWSKKDNYPQSRSFPKFSVNTTNEARWRPTQPDYLDALEPHWQLIRPLLLDSARQFKPDAAYAFSKDKNSIFYKEALEVWQSVKDSTPDRIALAGFFDDNPMTSVHQGHVTFSIKKITPPGHWLNITKTVAQQRKMSMAASVEAYTLTSIAVFDAIIACWTEKYNSALLRPVTYINQYIDPEWAPILQTPPFPEHTSGHSSISGAAATVLNQLVGHDVSFADSTETPFGMPVRTFISFDACADSAALSRMYAGIHYRNGMVAGLKNGRTIGKFVLEQLKSR